MATYVIGDLQGCFTPFRRLLDKIRFDPARDRLWLVGDLVNRGPQSLAVLRLLKNLSPQPVVVLGNHDLHLLATACRVLRPRPGDTLTDVLSAPDRKDLLNWLRTRPLLYRHEHYVLVHAGLLPSWELDQAEYLAQEVQQALQTEERPFLTALYRPASEEGDTQDDRLAHLVHVTAILTRLRYCSPDGRPVSSYKGPPSTAPPGLVPWFTVPHRRTERVTVIFGHWATLGLHVEPQFISLDSGCVWGGKLTAIRLEDRRIFQTPCPQASRPK